MSNTTPGLTYDNQDKNYVLTGFTAGIANTISYNDGTEDTVVDIYRGEEVGDETVADFSVPANEVQTLWYPRYDVPTEAEMADVQANAETNGAWAAESHGMDQYVKLSYYLYTTVSENSEMWPETDESMGGVDGFLKSITWQAYLYQGAGKTAVALDDLLPDLERVEGTEKEITTVNGQTYSVQEAVINTEGNSYNGYRVWIVKDVTVSVETAVLNAAAAGSAAAYSDGEDITEDAAENAAEDTVDRSEHVMPIGILFDFNESTTVIYSGDEGYATTTEGYAPQLMITSDAANPDSYLWATTNIDGTSNSSHLNVAGSLCIQPIYVDSAGGQHAGGYLPIKLYKESSNPTYTTVELDDTLEMTEPEDDSDPMPTIDAAELSSVEVEAYVYDQYGFQIKTKVPEVTVSPNESTSNEMIKAGKSNAFTVTGSENPFYLTYASEQTVNNAFPGVYTITANYNGAESGTASLQITKADDYLAFMASSAYPESSYWSARVGETYSDQTIYLTIPKKNSESWPQKNTTAEVGICVTELANQWRDPTMNWQSGRTTEYSVVSDSLMTEAYGVSCVNLTGLLTSGFEVDFEYALDENFTNKSSLKGVDFSTIPSGIVTYTSEVAEGSELYVRLTITPPKDLKNPDDAEGDGSLVQTYHFVFHQETKKEIVLLRASHNNNGQTEDGETGTLNLSLPEENATTVGTIKVNAYDQYGGVWLWSNVMSDSTYGKLGNWSLSLVPNSVEVTTVDGKTTKKDDSILTGVTIQTGGATSNEGIITVSPRLTSDTTLNKNMKYCEFKVRASFGMAMTSNTLTIRITRAASYPKKLVQYSDGLYAYCENPTVDVPTVDEPDQINSTQVKLQVIDQYGEEMSDGDYIVEWVVVTSETPNPDDTKLIFNKSTGELQVKSCAPAWSEIHLTFTVWGKNETGGKDSNHVLSKVPGTDSKYSYNKLVVQRTQSGASALEINTDTISLTEYADLGKSNALSASATTQYGENETPDSGASWTLLEVGYRDGTNVTMYTSYEYDDTKKEWTFGALTGKITQDTGNSSYVDASNKSVRLYERTGEVQINFKEDERKTADYIVVGLTYGGMTAIKQIDIDWADSYPDSIEIRTDLEDEKKLGAIIKVPNEGEIATKQLTGTVNVRDQFRFIIRQENRESVPCEWTIVGDAPTGVTLRYDEETGVYSLQVDNTAENGSVTVKASYTDSSSGEPAVLVTDIGIGRDPGTPTDIAVSRIQGQDDFDLYLPGLTENAETYYIDAQVKDNFGVVLSSQAVTWSVSDVDDEGNSVSGDPYGLLTVESVGTQGKLTIAATEAWHTSCNENTEVWIKATIPGTDISAVQKITVKMAEEYSAYAQNLHLVADETDFSQRTGRESFVAIPTKSSGKTNKATLEVEVYSQYGNLMPDAAVKISLDSELTGVKLGETVGHKAVMEVQSNADFTRLAYLSAVPTDVTEGKTAKSCSLTVGFDRAAAEETEIAFGTGAEVGVDDNTQEDSLVEWDLSDEEALAFQPTDEENYRVYDLYAFVSDQYGADYSKATTDPANWYPYWQFDAGCEGVTYGDDMSPDENGVVQGQHVTIKMSNKTMGMEEVKRTVTMKVWMKGYAPTEDNPNPSEVFCKTLTIVITKKTREAAYLYFENIDENGKGDALERPLAGETSQGKIAVQVYDQYGYIMEGESAALSLLSSSVTNQDSTAEVKVLYASEDPEADPEGEPVSYVVMRDETELARFDPATGIIELQPTFDLNYLSFGARHNDAKYTNLKIITIPITAETEQVATSSVQSSETGEKAESLEFVFNRASDEVMAEHLQVTMDNQYGISYSAGDIIAQWTLMVQNDDGSWTPYQELDSSGEPKPAEDWAVRLVTGSSMDVWVIVQPEQYTAPLTLQLQCTLLRNGVQVGEAETIDVSVRRKNTSSSSGESCIVVYQPGLHGKLVGEVVMQEVQNGRKPTFVPEVEPDSGWTLRGWRMDSGELVSDPTQIIIGGDTVFTAEYIELEKYQFLSGYDDGTVRPAADVTRGEFTRMLVDAVLGYNPEIDAKYANPFWDVGENRYYRDYIAYAYFYGVTIGYTDGTFRPDEPISRAEAASMLARAINVVPLSDGERFTDVDNSRWYSGFINALNKAGVVNGYKDGTFRPENSLTRAESVALLVRVGDEPPSREELELIRETGQSPFEDLTKDYWAYPYILRAAGVA